jgi:hypothetical protein
MSRSVLPESLPNFLTVASSRRVPRRDAHLPRDISPKRITCVPSSGNKALASEKLGGMADTRQVAR